MPHDRDKGHAVSRLLLVYLKYKERRRSMNGDAVMAARNYSKPIPQPIISWEGYEKLKKDKTLREKQKELLKEAKKEFRKHGLFVI